MKIYVGPLSDTIKSRRPKASYLTSIIDDLKHLDKFSKYELVFDESLRTTFHERTTIFKLDGKLILLDGNNKRKPSLALLENNELNDYSLIIKLQHAPSDLWDKFSVPITAWTFTERICPKFRNSFETYKQSEHEHRCGFIGRSGGKIHKDRTDIVLRLNNWENVDCDFWLHRDRGERTLSPDDYFNRLLSWKSALIPPGTVETGNDGKTWREIECAAMGLPMILDKPRNYWVKLRQFEHYIPVIDNDMNKAVDKATEDKELGRRAREWYEKAASAEGVCKTFVEILEKFL